MTEEQQPQPEQPQETTELTGLQRRLSDVVGQRNDLREQVASAQTQLGELDSLRQQVTSLQDQLKQSQSIKSDPFVQETQDPQTMAPADDIGAKIEAALDRKLGPIFQEQQKKELQASQQLAFDEAADLLPEIRTEGSDAQKLFSEIYNASPALQSDPRGPAIAIAAARGVLTEQSSGNQHNRKVAASSTPPQQRPLDKLPGPATEQDKYVAQVNERINAGEGLSDSELEGLLSIRINENRMKNQ